MKLRLAIAAACIALAGCAGATETPQQIVFNAEATQIVGIRLATVYKQLPLCGGAMVMPPLCSTAENVATVDKALEAADVAIESAERVVRDPDFGADVGRSAAVAAREVANSLMIIITALQK